MKWTIFGYFDLLFYSECLKCPLWALIRFNKFDFCSTARRTFRISSVSCNAAYQSFFFGRTLPISYLSAAITLACGCLALFGELDVSPSSNIMLPMTFTECYEHIIIFFVCCYFLILCFYDAREIINLRISLLYLSDLRGGSRLLPSPRHGDRTNCTKLEPETSIRDIVRQHGLSYSTIQRILKEEKLHIYHYTAPITVACNIYEKKTIQRKIFCEDFLQKSWRSRISFLCNI